MKNEMPVGLAVNIFNSLIVAGKQIGSIEINKGILVGVLRLKYRE